ncbi:MAG: hypothetical protein BIP78_1619 [Candidatus Bipolaricaulis sibiricus]|uniref:DUF4097 domain-containing protein n=1 Tax=Bipolaricaulis sibiricus TaxID=2501609 RepID=A0A410FWI0_BIPS1|nr:MAG: hypothetical protein BIP78_1619 [Candidatus Bipolaricaulis sibiricus]
MGGIGFALAGVALCLAGCDEGAFRAEATAADHHEFTVAGPVRLIAESSNGRIVVRGELGLQTASATVTRHSRGRTVAEAERRLGQLVYTAAANGPVITLRYQQADQPGDVGRYGGVDFEVTVPAEAEVEVRTSNGSIALQGGAGTAYLATSNGRVSVADRVGDLTVRTSNGEIRLERVQGGVDGETSNGWVHYVGHPEGIGPHRLRTSNGSVVVRVPRGLSIAFRASVSNGSITSDLALVGDTEGKDWNAVLNPPALTEMDLRTSNGSIRIEAAD